LDGLVKKYSYKKEQSALWGIFLHKSREKTCYGLEYVCYFQNFQMVGPFGSEAGQEDFGPGTGHHQRRSPVQSAADNDQKNRFAPKGVIMV
jgi:hypothetical protein